MGTFEPNIVVFCCQNRVGERGTEAVRREHGGRVRIVRMPCSGKTDVRYLLKAFEAGFFERRIVVVVEVVETDDLQPIREQPRGEVVADEAGGAGHKYGIAFNRIHAFMKLPGGCGALVFS